MAASNHFLLSFLPHLGDLGEAAPLTRAEFRNCVANSAGPLDAIDAMLLGDDLLQRQALLAGEIDDVEPAVLSEEQVRDEQPLPISLMGETQAGGFAAPQDALWEAYYRSAADVARTQRSGFLRDWVAHEVALRNALASARAKALDLDAGDYLVAVDLGDNDAEFSALLAEFASASDPMAALHAVDLARWAWLDAHESWFTFSDDELLVYAARLMLLERWRRFGSASDAEKPQTSTAQTKPERT